MPPAAPLCCTPAAAPAPLDPLPPLWAHTSPTPRPARARARPQEISQILDTGLDNETLSILIKLIESGVNPEALAAVVKELQVGSRQRQQQQRRRAADLRPSCFTVAV